MGTMLATYSVRRLLGWALVTALTVAALTASIALATGSFDETDWRVLGTSLGFAIFSATAAAGARLRFRSSDALRALSSMTVACSALAFVLLVVGVWSNEDSEGLAKAVACVGLTALALSHASLVVGAQRRSDSAAIDALVPISVAASVVDTIIVILAVLEAVEFNEELGRMAGVIIVVLLLTSALPPILRRLQGAPPARVDPTGEWAEPQSSSETLTLAEELLAAADRIEALNAEPGNRAPQIRRECERLRDIARSRA